MKNATTFVCPVLFDIRKDLEIKCIDTLISTIKANNNLDDKLFVAGHKDNTEFTDWQPPDAMVCKIYYNTKYSISESINKVAKTCDTEFFCFVQSDVELQDSTWISKFQNLVNNLPNAGVLGIQGHTDRSEFAYQIYPDITHVLFADAIMFFKSELFEEIGLFSTKYLGDRESEDFSYKAMRAGFKNYLVTSKLIGATHHITSFSSKLTNTDDLMKHAQTSTTLFRSKWTAFRQQYIQSFKKVYSSQQPQP